MDVYRKYTGDESCRPIVIGGGTYARAIENTVAFGARFPEDKELGHSGRTSAYLLKHGKTG